MIKSFADKRTSSVFHDGKGKRLAPDLAKAAQRKLVRLNTVGSVDDLRMPPGNRLEELKGDRQGQHSIRINNQWRICFRWDDGNVYEVEIVDYH